MWPISSRSGKPRGGKELLKHSPKNVVSLEAVLALVEASTLFRESTGGGEFFLVRYLIAFQNFLLLEGFSRCMYIVFAPYNLEVTLFLILLYFCQYLSELNLLAHL